MIKKMKFISSIKIINMITMIELINKIRTDQGLSKHQEVCFTPVMKVRKKYCDFLWPSFCNIKVDPEI